MQAQLDFTYFLVTDWHHALGCASMIDCLAAMCPLMLEETLLLGFSGQVDWLSQDNANNAGGLNGVGWLAQSHCTGAG